MEVMILNWFLTLHGNHFEAMQKDLSWIVPLKGGFYEQV